MNRLPECAIHDRGPDGELIYCGSHDCQFRHDAGGGTWMCDKHYAKWQAYVQSLNNPPPPETIMNSPGIFSQDAND